MSDGLYTAGELLRTLRTIAYS